MPSSALILGASGRIGRMLRHHGLDGVAPVWQYRQAVDHANAVVFDPLKESPDLGRYDTVLCLAGAISGTASALRSNRDLADAALDIGVACGAKRVFLASSAAVYGHATSPLTEDMPPQPISDYGRAKAEMEEAALSHAAQSDLPITLLRIGNVAGADALLGQASSAPISLDRFPDGQGPRRSYIGPGDLAAVMGALLRAGAAGQNLPTILNLSLPDAVEMSDLLKLAGRSFAWRPATDTALPLVVLDTSRLSQIVALPNAAPARIVEDWQSYARGAA